MAAAAIDGVILTLGTIWVVFFAQSFLGPFQSFLITLGVPLASWAGILIADILVRRKDYDEAALKDVSETVIALADAEALPAHGEAIRARFEDLDAEEG